MGHGCHQPNIAGIDKHIQLSMQKRGWTVAETQETYDKGNAYSAVDETANGSAATRRGKSSMLAETTSFTKSGLPKILQDKAIVLAGELAWPASEAVLVIDWLEANRQEVAGVELWRDVEGKPLFVASSDYSPGLNDQVTPESIAWCAHKARLFVARFSHKPDGLFNISTAEPLTKTNNASPKSALHIYSHVQLLTDRYQSEGASCFDLGYIVEVYPDNKYEVEFSGLDGITTALIVADGKELRFAPPAFAAPKPNMSAPRLNAEPIKEQ